LAEMLRDGHRFRNRRAEIGDQVPHPGRIRTQPREEADTRRIANRLLAVGTRKHHPRRGEPVEVRRLDMLDAVAAEVAAHVIDGDEQHIRFVGGLRTAAEQNERQEQDSRFHGLTLLAMTATSRTERAAHSDVFSATAARMSDWSAFSSIASSSW